MKITENVFVAPSVDNVWHLNVNNKKLS